MMRVFPESGSCAGPGKRAEICSCRLVWQEEQEEQNENDTQM